MSSDCLIGKNNLFYIYKSDDITNNNSENNNRI